MIKGYRFITVSLLQALQDVIPGSFEFFIYWKINKGG